MLSENFTYDNFNRLTGIQTNGVSYSMSYDRYGRMESKSQHDFSFDNARFSADHPHAVTRVQANRQPPFAGHSVTYTPFDKVQTVTMGNDNLLIEYGYDHQRIRMTEIVNGNQRVKTYVGNCEFIQPSTGDNYSLTYLSSPDGIFAVAESTSSGFRLHYVHTDNLGSWDIITDMGGDLEQSLSFDAWGNRRNASTWNGPAHDVPLFDRGFTGHEHLYNFGLINMNGRVYDPYMSTFLSPDNYIQCPDNSQNFNRYAYCLNNPLKYTDPSGEVFAVDDIIIAAVIGAMVNMAYQGFSGNITHDFLVTGSPMLEHQNYRNFSGWDLIETEETDALLRRISWTYGFDTVEKLGINVTTKAPDGFTIDPHSGIFINKNNDCIFGRVVYNPHPRGYIDMCSTIPGPLQYPRIYLVPSTYGFSIIDILKQIH